MIKTLIFLFSLVVSFLVAENPISYDLLLQKEDPTAMATHELAMLDDLISATQKSLEMQKELREQIKKYQEIQKEYAQNGDDNELLFRMVKHAQKIMGMINDNHLAQNFDPIFLSELNLFSEIASKYGTPKP